MSKPTIAANPTADGNVEIRFTVGNDVSHVFSLTRDFAFDLARQLISSAVETDPRQPRQNPRALRVH